MSLNEEFTSEAIQSWAFPCCENFTQNVTESVSLFIIGLFRLFMSWFGLGRLYVSRNLSIFSGLSSVLAYNYISVLIFIILFFLLILSFGLFLVYLRFFLMYAFIVINFPLRTDLAASVSFGMLCFCFYLIIFLSPFLFLPWFIAFSGMCHFICMFYKSLPSCLLLVSNSY